MIPLTEEHIIQDLLTRMMRAPRSEHNLADMLSGKQFVESTTTLGLIVKRLFKEGLVEEAAGKGMYDVTLSSRGVNAAEHVGGYTSYRKAILEQQLIQQQAQKAKEDREWQTDQATIDAAKAGRNAVIVAIAGLILSALTALYSAVQSQNSTAELEAMKSQIKALQQQTAHIKP